MFFDALHIDGSLRRRERASCQDLEASGGKRRLRTFDTMALYASLSVLFAPSPCWQDVGHLHEIDRRERERHARRVSTRHWSRRRPRRRGRTSRPCVPPRARSRASWSRSWSPSSARRSRRARRSTRAKTWRTDACEVALGLRVSRDETRRRERETLRRVGFFPHLLIAKGPRSCNRDRRCLLRELEIGSTCAPPPLPQPLPLDVSTSSSFIVQSTQRLSRDPYPRDRPDRCALSRIRTHRERGRERELKKNRVSDSQALFFAAQWSPVALRAPL